MDFRPVKLLFFAFLSVFLVSCLPARSPLEPKDLPRDRIASAVLRTPSAVLREGEFRDDSDFIRIVTVDGLPIKTLDNLVVLTPGEHEIQIAIEIRRSKVDQTKEVEITRSDTSLMLNAKPDGRYLVDATLTGVGLWIWIVDEDEGTIVSGRHPSGKASLVEDEESEEDL